MQRQMHRRAGQADPAVKLLAAALLAAGAVMAKGGREWAAVLAAISCAYLSSGATCRDLFHFLRPLLWFALCAILLGEGAGGRIIVHIGAWTYTSGDLWAGLRTAFRFLAVVASVVWFSATTGPGEVAAALLRLAAPARRLGKWGQAADSLVMAVFLALRFLPLTLREADTLRLAQTARGAPLRTGWRRGAAYLPGLALPLFAGVLRRADAVAATIVLRGFRPGEPWAGNLPRLRLQRPDLALLGVAGAAMLFVLLA